MQEDGFSHADLVPAARAATHERRLREAVERRRSRRPATCEAPARSGPRRAAGLLRLHPGDPVRGRPPPSSGARRASSSGASGEPRRVALVADGVGGMHGVTHTLDEIRERGVPGFEVEVIGTDPNVDRRLPAVAEVEIPFYEGLRVGVPSLPAAVEALAEGRYDLVHLCSPGPAGVAAALIARIMELPLVGSYHTELGAYAGLRSGDARLRAGMDIGAGRLLRPVRRSSSRRARRQTSRCGRSGVPAERIGRWDRGVDMRALRPGAARAGLAARRADRALRRAADHARRARTCSPTPSSRARAATRACTSCWPAAVPRRTRCASGSARTRRSSAGSRARSWRAPTRAPTSSSSPSRTDTFGQVDPRGAGERAAGGGGGRGRPAVADRGRPHRPPLPADADALAAAVCELARFPELRRRLADAALATVRGRTWEHALERLAAGYRRALDARAISGGGARRTAA